MHTRKTGQLKGPLVPSSLAGILVAAAQVAALHAVSAAEMPAQFGMATNFPCGGSPRALIAADFNRDGTLDIAVARGGVGLSVLLGFGEGTLAASTNYTASADTLAASDFNNDGNPDLIAAGSYNTRILLGNGAGGFSVFTNLANSPGYPKAVAVADINNDGNTDLAIAVDYSCMIAFGRGDGSFTAPTNYSLATIASDVHLVDLNGIGRRDLVISLSGTTSVHSNSFCILTNKGDGNFGPPRYYSAGPHPAGYFEAHPAIETADLNGDGRPDLAVLNSHPSLALSNSVNIWLNQGNRTFTTTRRYALGIVPSDITAADFNGDEITDLVARGGNLLVSPGGGPVMRVLFGIGDGSFVLSQPINAPSDYGANHPALACGDFNGDGTPDLAFANYSSNSVAIMLNQTPPILKITPLGGYNQLGWPATFGAGFVLEYTTNLSTPNGWQPFPHPPVQIGTQKAITDWTDCDQKFYRLRK